MRLIAIELAGTVCFIATNRGAMYHQLQKEIPILKAANMVDEFVIESSKVPVEEIYYPIPLSSEQIDVELKAKFVNLSNEVEQRIDERNQVLIQIENEIQECQMELKRFKEEHIHEQPAVDTVLA